MWDDLEIKLTHLTMTIGKVTEAATAMGNSLMVAAPHFSLSKAALVDVTTIDKAVGDTTKKLTTFVDVIADTKKQVEFHMNGLMAHTNVTTQAVNTAIRGTTRTVGTHTDAWTKYFDKIQQRIETLMTSNQKDFGGGQTIGTYLQQYINIERALSEAYRGSSKYTALDIKTMTDMLETLKATLSVFGGLTGSDFNAINDFLTNTKNAARLKGMDTTSFGKADPAANGAPSTATACSPVNLLAEVNKGSL